MNQFRSHRTGASSRSPWLRWLRGLARIVPTAEDDINLSDPEIKAIKQPLHITGEEAVKLAMDPYTPDREKHDGLTAFHRIPFTRREDLPFAVLIDMDLILFSGVLKGNVYLRWARLPPGLLGTTVDEVEEALKKSRERARAAVPNPYLGRVSRARDGSGAEHFARPNDVADWAWEGDPRPWGVGGGWQAPVKADMDVDREWVLGADGLRYWLSRRR